MTKVAIHTDNAPRPVASYAQAVRRGNIVHVAGQGPGEPATGEFVRAEIREQTRQALDNVCAILAEAGTSLDDAVMVRVYLARHSDFAGMNEVYEKYVNSPFPGRTTVYVGLPPDMLVEIDVLAVTES